MNNEESNLMYAPFGRRIKASVLDSVILLGLFVAIPVVVGNVIQGSLGCWGVVMYAPVLFLEPLLVSYWGQTIGQYLFGITVVREADQSGCPLLSSFLRYYAKASLGLWSMMYMLFSKRNKAIHDYIAHTVVVLSPHRLHKTPSFAEKKERELEIHEEYIYPPGIRRFILFIIWGFAVVFSFGTLTESLLSSFLGPDRAASLLKSGDRIMGLFDAILLVATASLAVKGFLPGARRHRKFGDTGGSDESAS